MYGLTHESGRAVYGLKHFVLDTEAEVKNLPTDDMLIPGSTAFVISTSNSYMLNNQYSWVKVNLSNGSGGSGNPDPGTDNTYIWDGGDVGS